MQKKQTKQFGTHLSMIFSIAIIAALMLLIGVQAAPSTNVPAEAVLADPDCFWSDGPGTELYVPSGKTCTISSNTSASNVTGWTDYAVIVYSGGTLEIVASSANTTLTVDGDMYVMGTVDVGDGVSSSYNNVLDTNNTSSIYVMQNGIFNVNTNGGAGNNYILADDAVYVGDKTDSSAAQINFNDDSSSDIENKLEVYDTANINDGVLSAGSLAVNRPTSSGQSSVVTVASSAELSIDLYHTCTMPDGGGGLCIMEVGYDNNSTANLGDATLNVEGLLTVQTNAADRSIFIGLDNRDGLLNVTGTMSVGETTSTFGGPGPLDDPSNYFGVFSDGSYGLQVAGTLQTGMFLWNNNGYINVTSAGSSGNLQAEQGYMQASSLNIDAGDKMTITGEADISGDATINGELNVSDCTKITNGSTESFDIGSTGIFDTGDASCSLTGTQSDDGLNVQGADTSFTIANGADLTDDDGDAGDIQGQFTVDNSANVDANGFFDVDGDDLVVQNGGIVTLNDTDAGDTFTSDNLVVEPESGGTTSSSLTIEANTTYHADNGGSVTIGTVSSSGTGALTVHGTVNTHDIAPSDVLIGSSGSLIVQPTGIFNSDGTSTGIFTVNGGSANAYGEIVIYNQELQFTDGNINVFSTGSINSTAFLGSAPGFDYDDGNLDIDYGGQARFDDDVEIDTATGSMTVGGLLEGTNNVYIGCVGSTCKVEDSGEIRVIGTGTPQITVEQDMDLLGKLNGDGGAGNITVEGANSAKITSVGDGSEDSYAYIVANDLEIESGAEIDMSNFVNCYLPSAPRGYGGSYGGIGGGGLTTTFGEVKYFTAPVYPGTPNPVGMCGLSADGGTETYGGGAVYIEVHNDLTVNGPIRANGQFNADNSEGAGSGGLIIIDHKITHSDTGASFTGSANIEANGGNGTGITDSYGGGGGRIVISSILLDDPDDTDGLDPDYQYAGTVYADGGTINNGSPYAAAGTIVYMDDYNNTNDTLIVDQNNRTPDTGLSTYIQNTGDFVFDRVDAREAAVITYDVEPTTSPVSCYENDLGSSVELASGDPVTFCDPNPDKPDTLYINDSYTGAQSSEEPWVGGTVAVSDLTPEFSAIARNPENSSSLDKVRIQVDTTPTFGAPGGCLGCVWDADVTLDSATGINSRSENIEYAGSALSGGNTYYVRMAFYDSSGTNLGLWTHRDMDNHYKFTVESSWFDITNNCSDLIEIRDQLAAGRAVGSPLKYTDGDRYGSDSCRFTLNSGTAGWKVLYGKSPTGGNFSDGNGNYTISPIDNSTDCKIDTSGNTGALAQEEYGYNISSVSLNANSIVQTDPTCSQDYDSWDSGTGDYLFNIEDNGSEDTIIDNTTSAASSEQFDLNTYATVDQFTQAETYTLDTWMIMAPSP